MTHSENFPNLRGDIHTITIDAEPGAHRFRFVVDGESRTSKHYRLATDHQNVVVNYLDHVKPDDESDAGSYDSEFGMSSVLKSNISDEYVPPAPKEVWTREIPAYLRFRDRSTPSPGSSHSTDSSNFSYHAISSYSPPQSPAPLKGHIMNPHITPIEKADLSVLQQPSHSVLGHLGIRTTTSDGLLATTVTMRYKHKVFHRLQYPTDRQFVTTILYRPVDDD